jgi:FAD/FMN-containing dehydrogenase
MLQHMLLDTAFLYSSAVHDLEAHLLGPLLRPAHDDFASARKVYNLAVDQNPALVARPADAADVIRLVTFAQDYDLPLAIRSGGHSMAGHGTVEGGLVIDLRDMHGLSIDAERRVAWAQPGLTWGQYATSAGAYGLATSAGDTASVGLGGLTLGGGIGWMVRKHGLTIDNLLSVEMVSADGRLLRASETEHPDLFWALRGGGGNFGVATAFQLRLHQAGMIFGGAVVYSATTSVLRDWADYAAQAPDELTTIVFMMPAPPAPFIPADQVGKPVVVIGVCYSGDLESGAQVVQPLRELGTPVADICGPMPYPAMFALTEEATRPQAHAIRSGFFSEFGDQTLDTLVDAMYEGSAEGRLIQLRALGGAASRVPVEATAFAHRDQPFMAAIIGGTFDPAEIGAQREWTSRTWNAIAPQARGVYSNFLEDEGEARVAEAYPADTYARLKSVKRTYDPRNVFHLNQNIRP